MPPRSQVITMLPAYIRQAVERRMLENGFRDWVWRSGSFKCARRGTPF